MKNKLICLFCGQKIALLIRMGFVCRKREVIREGEEAKPWRLVGRQIGFLDCLSWELYISH